MPETPKTPNDVRPGKDARSGQKVANRLVMLSSAAVMAIYTAGYQRTRTAAEQFDVAAAQRRPVVPAPAPDVRSTEGPPPAAAEVVAAASAATASPVPHAPTTMSPEAAAADHPAPALAAVAPGPTTNHIAAVPSPPAGQAPAEEPIVSGPEGAAIAEAVPVGNPVATPALPTSPSTPAAPETAATPAAPAAILAQYKDGTYHAWGRSRHGDVYAFVVIEHGRIVHSGYDKCQTRWSCTLIDHLGPQVVVRQSAEVDWVSGATDSGNAFYWGVVEALAKAKVEAAPEAAVSPSADSK